MAENLILPTKSSKAERYQSLIPQLQALLQGESDIIANMANMAAGLKEAFNFFWVGFYIVKGNELVLGPFQGPIACTRIAKGKGVCGACFKEAKSVIVPDVDEFPGHIACNALSKSEIVIPVVKNGLVQFILDVDSAQLNAFDETDEKYLSKLVKLLE